MTISRLNATNDELTGSKHNSLLSCVNRLPSGIEKSPLTMNIKKKLARLKQQQQHRTHTDRACGNRQADFFVFQRVKSLAHCSWQEH